MSCIYTYCQVQFSKYTFSCKARIIISLIHVRKDTNVFTRFYLNIHCIASSGTAISSALSCTGMATWLTAACIAIRSQGRLVNGMMLITDHCQIVYFVISGDCDVTLDASVFVRPT